MVNDSEAVKSDSLNGLKWLVALAMIVAGAAGNVVYAEFSLLYRVLALIVVFGLAGLVLLGTSQGRYFRDLVQGAISEVQKVTWPTRQETWRTTLVVVAVVVLVGLFLWMADWLVGWLIQMLIG
jgi:preprotein translocase subunit SecE